MGEKNVNSHMNASSKKEWANLNRELIGSFRVFYVVCGTTASVLVLEDKALG